MEEVLILNNDLRLLPAEKDEPGEWLLLFSMSSSWEEEEREEIEWGGGGGGGGKVYRV